MIVTYLDLHTGKRVSQRGISRFDLCENNWSCDCNRALAFGNEVPDGYCVGSHRYIAIDVRAESAEELCNMGDATEVLKEANESYLHSGGKVPPLVRYPIPECVPMHSNPVYTDRGLWCYQEKRGWIPATIRFEDGIFVAKGLPKWWAHVPNDEVDWEEET